jgi:hypothetical protein
MNEPVGPSESFDPSTWEGDREDLAPFQEELLYSLELCEQTFCSKQEALAAGF